VTFDAAILVGGAGRRMGGAVKPLLEFRGRRILDRQLEVLRPRFENIALATSNPEPFADVGPEVVPDVIAGAGPLAALVAVLDWAQADHLFVVAGDMPTLSGPVVDYFLESARSNPDADVIVARTDGRIQPLHAVYRRGSLSSWQLELRSGTRSLSRVIESGSVSVSWIDDADLRRLDADLSFARNVNYPEELA